MSDADRAREAEARIARAAHRLRGDLGNGVINIPEVLAILEGK